jgi:membrane protein YdbS with pleckstrin-like domain
METVWENLQVPISDLPQVEDVHFQSHPVRYRSLRFLIGSIWLGIIAIAFTVTSTVSPGLWVVFAGIPLLLFIAFSFTSMHFGFKSRSYALRQNDITYKKGWLFYSITTIPFNRIQHTEVSQGPLERKFTLCTLKIYTAGGSTSDLSVPGLEQDEAQQLRDFIARKAASYA